MHPALRVALLLALPTLAAAQEYQVAFAFTRASTSFDFRDHTGAPSSFEPKPQSATAPSLFGDVQAPVLTVKEFHLTGDIGLRWPLGDDVGVITLGFGVAHAIEGGYAGLHYLRLEPVNGTSVLGQDWGIGTEGLRAIVRRRDWRLDLTRTSDHLRHRNGYGTDDRANTRMALAVRWRMLGVELERWHEDNFVAPGAHSITDLQRLSAFVAFGQR